MRDAESVMAAIEKLMKSQDAYMLEERQFADIGKLRAEAKALCESNKVEDAHDIFVEIRNIVMEGSAVHE